MKYFKKKDKKIGLLNIEYAIGAITLTVLGFIIQQLIRIT